MGLAVARGNVRHQLSEAQGPSEEPGRNPLVNPDTMIFQEGSLEGVTSSLTKGLVPHTRGNIIRVGPLESQCVEKPIKRPQPMMVSLDFEDVLLPQLGTFLQVSQHAVRALL
jgi:hypothetical protein